jgi:hypothetical protein
MVKYDEGKAAKDLQTAFWTLEDRWDEWAERGLELRSVTLRPPKGPGLDWSLVIRAVVEGHRVVCFLDAERPERLFTKLVGSVQAGTLKWLEDKYGD